MSVQTLQEHHFPFVSFAVKSETGIEYTVEIRSLTQAINSCSCPEFSM